MESADSDLVFLGNSNTHKTNWLQRVLKSNFKSGVISSRIIRVTFWRHFSVHCFPHWLKTKRYELKRTYSKVRKDFMSYSVLWWFSVRVTTHKRYIVFETKTKEFSANLSLVEVDKGLNDKEPWRFDMSDIHLCLSITTKPIMEHKIIYIKPRQTHTKGP